MMKASRASGLRLAGVEIGDPSHRESGQVGDLAACVPGDRQWQGPDGSGLVNDHQHCSVLGLQLVEQLAQFRFAVGQRLVEHLLPRPVHGGGVVIAFADVQAQIDVDARLVRHALCSRARVLPGLTCGISVPASTLRRDCPVGRSCL